jgi:hypothetical protein
MNKTGKVKAAILVILSLPNLFFPMQLANEDYSMAITSLIFGIIAVIFFTKLNLKNKGKKIDKPHWNDNPINTNNRLAVYQFWGFFFLSIGASMIIGSLLKFQLLNTFGLTSVLFGIGILLGIFLSLKLFIKT